MKASRQRILVATILAEGLLLTIATIWIYLGQININFQLTVRQVVIALIAIVPLLFFNWILFWKQKGSAQLVYEEFLRKYIFPLCRVQTLFSAIVIALFSGLAEELFFRAVLLNVGINWLGLGLSLVLTNSLFAYVHFLGTLRRYWRISIFYFLFGCYFSFLYVFLDSYWVPAIAHAAYNFTVIIVVRNFLLKADSNGNQVGGKNSSPQSRSG